MDLLSTNRQARPAPPPPILVDPPAEDFSDNASEMLAVQVVQPTEPPAPCSKCGCCYHWQDLAKRLHCCQCQRIPAKRMLRQLWSVRSGEPNYWWPWSPRYWQPFAELEREQQELAKAQAASESF